MKYCHVFKAAGIYGIHPRHPLVSAALALQAFKLSCLKRESTNIKGRRGSDANHCQPRSSWSFVFVLRSSFVVFRFGVSLCLQHNMLDNGNPLLSYMMPKTSNQASVSEDWCISVNSFEVAVKLKIYFQRAQNTMVNPGAETQPKCLLQVTKQSYWVNYQLPPKWLFLWRYVKPIFSHSLQFRQLASQRYAEDVLCRWCHDALGYSHNQ